MKRLISIVLLLMVGYFAVAQQMIPLYDGIPPGLLDTVNRETMVHPEKGRPSLINVSYPAIYVFRPPYPNPAHTTVMICPGGGYERLTIEDGGFVVAKKLAAEGITAVVLKYRTFQKGIFENYSTIPLQDLRRAMELLHQHAAEWQINEDHIGLMGFSAGGHLVAMAANTQPSLKLAFTIMAYPVISFMDPYVSARLHSRNNLIGTNASDALKRAYSPELQVTTATPPALLLQAENDSTSLVSNSLVYYEALRAHRVPAKMLLYQQGGHGFAAYNKAEKDDWIPEAIRWMELNGWYQHEEMRSSAPPFWDEIQAFRRADYYHAPPAHPILFIGSSSFRKWDHVQDYFPGYTILNRGFGGSVLPDVIRYAYDILLPYQPKQVLIYCGENDLASPSVTAAEVVLRYKTLFTLIRQNLPAARISFVSIKPSPVRANIQDKVKAANKDIKAFIKTQPNADFINVYDAMILKDGSINESIFLSDMLHMKPSGYKIWQKIMLPYLMK